MNEFAKENFVPTEMIFAQIITDILVVYLSSAKTGSPLVEQICNKAKELIRSLESMAKLNKEAEFTEWKKVNKKRVRRFENYYSGDTLRAILRDTPIKIQDQTLSIDEVIKILKTTKSDMFLRIIRDLNTE